MKATSVKQIYQLFDPLHDLCSQEELTRLYVDRNSGVRQAVKLALDQDLERQKTVHILFSGQSGSGKSTEINKLCSELKDLFFIIKVPFKNRDDIGTADVILKAAMALFKAVTDETRIEAPVIHQLEDLFSELYLFLHHQLFHEVPVSRNLDTALTAHGKINLLADEFEARFEVESLSRTVFKLAVETHLADLIDRMNHLTATLRELIRRPVLFIFEDADKFNLHHAQDIFYHHSHILLGNRASSIYIIDMALPYQPGFTGAEDCFTHVFSLPNLSLVPFERDTYYAYEDETDAHLLKNRTILETVIDRRAEAYLFEPGVKNLCLKNSGGLLRTLVSLIQNAAIKAHTDNSPVITLAHVNYAVAKQLGMFIPQLNKNHYTVLALLQTFKDLSSDADIQFLLRTTALLAYEQGGHRCEPHPILLPEVQRRALSARTV